MGKEPDVVELEKDVRAPHCDNDTVGDRSLDDLHRCNPLLHKYMIAEAALLELVRAMARDAANEDGDHD